MATTDANAAGHGSNLDERDCPEALCRFNKAMC